MLGISLALEPVGQRGYSPPAQAPPLPQKLRALGPLARTPEGLSCSLGAVGVSRLSTFLLSL